MKLRSAALLIFVFLLAMPSLAQNRLPAPKIVAIKIEELKFDKGIHDWCIDVAWEKVPGAAIGRRWREYAGYAIRLWAEGNNTPKSSHPSVHGLYAPDSAGWTKISHRTVTVWSERNIIVASTCGYAENQKVKVRVRAIDKKGKHGKVSKVFTVKLPAFGAYGNPSNLKNQRKAGDGHYVYGSGGW